MNRLLSAAAAAALGLTAATADAETRWDMPTPYPDATFHTQNIRQFAEDVSEATEGELAITVHSAGSLFKHPEIKRAVQTGQVPIGEVFISLLGNEDPVFAVDSIPFLATSYEEAEALWQASRPVIEEKLAEQGLMLLYAVPWPPQGLYSTELVTSVADLAGVRFRAYNPTTSRLAELMGAVPTQVEVPDIPQAFATGIVEAMITSPTTGVNSAAWDYVNYFYDIRAWVPKNMVIVNRRAFGSLPAEVQDAVLAAAEAAEARGWRMSAEEAAEQIRVLAENGMEVMPATETFAEQLETVGATLTEEWLESAGPEGRAIIQDYIARTGEEPPQQ